MRDHGLRARLGADNRDKAVREFGLDRMVAAYDDLFASTARDAGAAKPIRLKRAPSA
jgi:hypothetical protein